MAASDGIKQYWKILTDRPDLVRFTYLDAQHVWQRHFANVGVVRFHDRPSYISFMQALMMDGVKGTALIGLLGELYSAAGDPGATASSILKATAKAALKKHAEYHAQMKSLKDADLSWAWRNAANSSCSFIFEHMKEGQEISYTDVG